MYLCTVLNVNAVLKMNKELLNDFSAFRFWFNKRFSLSLDGKFAGLLRLKDWKRFAYRLSKILNGYYRKPFNGIITMRVSGQTIKLYDR